MLLLAACGDAAEPDIPSPIFVDLGEVPVGGRTERSVPAGAWRDGAALVGDASGLELLLSRRGDERLLSIA